MGDDDLARPVTGHWCIRLWHWQSGLRDAEADLSASNISPTLPESSLDLSQTWKYTFETLLARVAELPE